MAKHPGIALVLLLLVAFLMFSIVVPEIIKSAQSAAISAGVAATRATEDAKTATDDLKNVTDRLAVLNQQLDAAVKQTDAELSLLKSRIAVLNQKFAPLEAQVTQVLDDPGKRRRASDLIREVTEVVAAQEQSSDVIGAAVEFKKGVLRIEKHRILVSFNSGEPNAVHVDHLAAHLTSRHEIMEVGAHLTTVTVPFDATYNDPPQILVAVTELEGGTPRWVARTTMISKQEFEVAMIMWTGVRIPDQFQLECLAVGR